jgi:hypothetical protein
VKRYLLTVAALAALAGTALAQPPGPVPAKAGHASFTFGDTVVTYDQVQGDFNETSGFTMIMLNFSKDGKPGGDHLGISLLVQKAGPVDLTQAMGNGIGYWKGGKIFAYQKDKSRCTLTVTKLAPGSVEGTAECPVINEQFGQGTSTLTSVKFSASTK